MINEIKVWRLFICPQTHIRINKKERWMFGEGVTDEYLIEFGTKVYKQKIEEEVKNPGTPQKYLNRKNVIKRYFDYKRALKAEALRQGFEMPKKDAWVKFYMPMPPSWSQKKKNRMCFELHESKPDVDNLIKALKDSLVAKDSTISDYRSSKFWYSGTGHIEITMGELPPVNGYTKIIREDKIK